MAKVTLILILCQKLSRVSIFDLQKPQRFWLKNDSIGTTLKSWNLQNYFLTFPLQCMFRKNRTDSNMGSQMERGILPPPYLLPTRPKLRELDLDWVKMYGQSEKSQKEYKGENREGIVKKTFFYIFRLKWDVFEKSSYYKRYGSPNFLQKLLEI